MTTYKETIEKAKACGDWEEFEDVNGNSVVVIYYDIYYQEQYTFSKDKKFLKKEKIGA